MPRGTIVDQKTKLEVAKAVKAGSMTAEAAAKKCDVTPITVRKWMRGDDIGPRGANGNGHSSGKPQRSAGDAAQREAIAYLRHARDEINDELRDGRIKKLSQAHLLTLLALEALGGS